MKAKRKTVAPGAGDRDLDVEIARRVMGWKAVGDDGQAEIWGKKQDKAGRWRKMKVPPYSADSSLIADVEDRMKQLHLLERYEKELEKATARSKMPESWASPEQKLRAALAVVKRSKQQLAKIHR